MRKNMLALPAALDVTAAIRMLLDRETLDRMDGGG